MNTLQRLISILLCLALLCCSTALADISAGSVPADLKPSYPKAYVKLKSSPYFFTGALYGSGMVVRPPTGTVCQLYTEDYYTASDGRQYWRVYYNNALYNCLRADLVSSVMSETDLETYITGVLWQQSTYTTLKKALNLVGDVRVHALQLALQRLGYYKDKLDGNYGDGTAAAVKAFQKSQGLTADGSAGSITQPLIYAQALGWSSSGSSSSSASTGTSTRMSGTLKTTSSVNLRKSASTSSARLAILPKNTNLQFTDSTVKDGVTWYKVKYSSLTGWLMGSFVKIISSSGGSSSSSSGGNANTPAIGKVRITKNSTRVRKEANGSKSGYVLSKGNVVDQIGATVSSGGYNWYNIRTASGLCGWVRGDCAEIVGQESGSTGTGGTGTSSGVVPVSDTTFVRLPGAVTLFTTETQVSGGVVAPSGSYIRLLSTYTVGSTQYAKVNYNNKNYNCVYANIASGILSPAQLSDVVQKYWNSALPSSLKPSNNLVGNIYVYALQAALASLNYYNGKLDGSYGNATETAVRNYQRQHNLTVDGACGTKTWSSITSALKGSGTSGGSSSSGSSSSGGSPVVVPSFGTVKAVMKADWNYDDNGAGLFPKGKYAMVMDVDTGKVFQVYRWSGGSHADCVPATTTDTKTMCDIVGFPYNSAHPNSSQLSKIKSDGDSSTVMYTWPDFKATLTSTAVNIGSKWDRRAALLNVDGNVYCVSIYGFPHGFNGTSSFCKSKFPDGTLFYEKNNFYGMICIHFGGSKTHSGSSPDSGHQANLTKAYEYAKSKWPALCK